MKNRKIERIIQKIKKVNTKTNADITPRNQTEVYSLNLTPTRRDYELKKLIVGNSVLAEIKSARNSAAKKKNNTILIE